MLGALRVTGYGGNTVVGGMAQPGSAILTGTSTGRVVTVDLDADQQGEVATGDKVTITLPNGQSTPGTVTSVGTVATPRRAVGTADPTDHHRAGHSQRPGRLGNSGSGPGQVSITTGSAKNALVVQSTRCSLLPVAGTDSK